MLRPFHTYPPASAPAAAAVSTVIIVLVLVVVDCVSASAVSPFAVVGAARRRTVVLALAAWEVEEVDRLPVHQPVLLECCSDSRTLQ